MSFSLHIHHILPDNKPFSQHRYCFVEAGKAQVWPESARTIPVSLELGHLNGMQPSLVLWVAPVHFLLWQVKTSAVKRICLRGGFWEWFLTDKLHLHLFLKKKYSLLSKALGTWIASNVFKILLIFTSTDVFRFVPLLLAVCDQDYTKTTQSISTKLGWRLGLGQNLPYLGI